MSNLDLIKDLIKQAEQITYSNSQRDAVEKRAEMLFRKIFGNSTPYLKSLKDIRYSPGIWSTSTPPTVFENSFNSGKKQLLNLLNVIAEDLQIDSMINEPQKQNGTNSFLSSNVFIVHGHNEEMKLAAARTIGKLRLNPIILHEQPNKGKTIIEKFAENSDVAFAIVLLSADDIAYNKNEKVETAKFRARQNVIFELGYFIGKLGRDKVFVLHEIENDFEIPSDYSGVLFVPFDKTGKWQFDLVKELKAIGISVDANDIL